MPDPRPKDPLDDMREVRPFKEKKPMRQEDAEILGSLIATIIGVAVVIGIGLILKAAGVIS